MVLAGSCQPPPCGNSSLSSPLGAPLRGPPEAGQTGFPGWAGMGQALRGGSAPSAQLPSLSWGDGGRGVLRFLGEPLSGHPLWW